MKWRLELAAGAAALLLLALPAGGAETPKRGGTLFILSASV